MVHARVAGIAFALILISILIAGPRQSFAAEPSAEKIDAIFAQFDKPDSPGAAVAVIKDGEIVFKNGYGSAQLEYGIPITPETIFHVASVSKQFTAFCIALLADEGKLSLDDPVQKHVPELPEFEHETTIRHLIHHTSGIRDQWSLLTLAGWRMDDVITEGDVLDLLSHQQDLNFTPGAEYLYSNAGYTLLAVIVERVSGKRLKEFAEERVFGPLGMKSTHFHDDHRHIVPGRAYSYAPTADGGYQKSVLSYAIVGATSLFTTVEDLALWQNNFTKKKIGGDSVIEMMHTRAILNSGEEINYAFALQRGELQGEEVWAHSGGDAGFRSYLMGMPGHGLSVAVLSNAANANTGALANAVAEAYLPEPADSDDGDASTEQSAAPEFIKLDAAAMRANSGGYIDEVSGQIIRVAYGVGKLRVIQNGQPRAFLPVAEHRFVMADPPYALEVRFSDHVEGKPTKLQVRANGNVVGDLVAVASFKPSTEELAEFAGEYLSPELDVVYRLRISEGKLVLWRRPYGDQTLRPSAPDRFDGGPGNLAFTRSEAGEINGFLVNTGRVRNLKFIRRSD